MTATDQWARAHVVARVRFRDGKRKAGRWPLLCFTSDGLARPRVLLDFPRKRAPWAWSRGTTEYFGGNGNCFLTHLYASILWTRPCDRLSPSSCAGRASRLAPASIASRRVVASATTASRCRWLPHGEPTPFVVHGVWLQRAIWLPQVESSIATLGHPNGCNRNCRYRCPISRL
ncbi:hypothetical protein T440DRAFT_183769 [Plenodomus tracheiphilus IPT5]|uniref:Uncharacterized protein n=1 Tax=Plenodomus tracheiphilus IPT5 TaxID=1408161 RepID=A0A6A7B0D4_9PLEO|nr:hypothetical protein T440DRAFT_183769 [Plenodomus tracheiphilus IPT5]